MLTLIEHKSSSYGPRTYVNAAVGDLTLAIAVDHTTAGERLTRKAAGARLLTITPNEDEILQMSRTLWREINRRGIKTLNIAGNGIYTLSKHGWSQERMNSYVYNLLKPVVTHYELSQIVSGGQTGVDLAGGIAGLALGIPVTMTLPKGFKQRWQDGIDVEASEHEVRDVVDTYLKQLRSD